MNRTLVYIALLLIPAGTMAIAQSRHVPNLQFEDLTGNKHRIADLRGSVAVVNYWATWCVPCREELPMLSILSKQYAGKKVRFVSVSADDDPKNRKQRDKIKQFLNDYKPGVEIWLGADLDALQRCEMGQILPATLILDSDGQVVSRVEGEAREEDITRPIEWILSGQTGPAPPAVVKRF